MIEDDFLENDEEYEKYKLRRLKELEPQITEIKTELDLIEKSNKETMIVHFYDKKFQSCIIMNKELNKIFKLFNTINFYKVQAVLCPAVTSKLEISVLPFLGFFKDGYFVDQVVGFSDMGDERFDPKKLKRKIEESNLFKPISFIK